MLVYAGDLRNVGKQFLNTHNCVNSVEKRFMDSNLNVTGNTWFFQLSFIPASVMMPDGYVLEVVL